MKEHITIYYNKDKRHPNDYIFKRVLTQEGENYSLTCYYMINDCIKVFHSSLKWSGEKINRYVLECMKSDFFDKIEAQFIMEGI